MTEYERYGVISETARVPGDATPEDKAVALSLALERLRVRAEAHGMEMPLIQNHYDWLPRFVSETPKSLWRNVYARGAS